MKKKCKNNELSDRYVPCTFQFSNPWVHHIGVQESSSPVNILIFRKKKYGCHSSPTKSKTDAVLGLNTAYY